MNLTLLHEDEQLIILDKPAGVSVHPGQGRVGVQTIVDLIRDKVNDPDSERPGIVHRLDRDTSGVLVIAKDAKTKAFLQQQFQQRTVKKVYLALVNGVPKLEHAILDWPIGRHRQNPLKRAVIGRGKPAQTEYKIKKTYLGPYALLEVSPKTGRTHQIRVHLAHLGHPVVGDRLYGRRPNGLKRHWLHAHKLTLKLPSGSRKTFTSPLPKDLKAFLKKLTPDN